MFAVNACFTYVNQRPVQTQVWLFKFKANTGQSIYSEEKNVLWWSYDGGPSSHECILFLGASLSLQSFFANPFKREFEAYRWMNNKIQ